MAIFYSFSRKQLTWQLSEEGTRVVLVEQLGVCLVSDEVLSAGIEPTSEISETPVLSVEL